jgi:hypothetical protein
MAGRPAVIAHLAGPTHCKGRGRGQAAAAPHLINRLCALPKPRARVMSLCLRGCVKNELPAREEGAFAGAIAA